MDRDLHSTPSITPSSHDGCARNVHHPAPRRAKDYVSQECRQRKVAQVVHTKLKLKSLSRLAPLRFAMAASVHSNCVVFNIAVMY